MLRDDGPLPNDTTGEKPSPVRRAHLNSRATSQIVRALCPGIAMQRQRSMSRALQTAIRYKDPQAAPLPAQARTAPALVNAPGGAAQLGAAAAAVNHGTRATKAAAKRPVFRLGGCAPVPTTLPAPTRGRAFVSSTEPATAFGLDEYWNARAKEGRGCTPIGNQLGRNAAHRQLHSRGGMIIGEQKHELWPGIANLASSSCPRSKLENFIRVVFRSSPPSEKIRAVGRNAAHAPADD